MAYEEHYSEDRFWSKIKSIFKSLGERAICQIFTLYYLAKSDKVTTADKLLITGTLGYLILPVDVIPDFLIGIGYTDDMGAIVGLLVKLIGYIDDDIVNKVHDAVNNLFPVEYEKVKKYVYSVKI